MRLAIDTNRYRDYVNGEPEALKPIEQADQVFVPLIVIAELRAGFRLGSRQNENEATLAKILREPQIEILFPDEATTHFYAQILVDLRNRGTPIPSNDLWIAAMVIQHGLTLFTRDRHFSHVPMVPRI